MKRFLRFFYWFVALLAVAGGALVWWFVYRPLPVLDGQLSLPGLLKEVTVERDNWGVPHIRASSLNDLCEAQGYTMAQDRLWQMDLLRRVARGQLSEIVGSDALPLDQEFRTLRLGAAAERDVTLLDPEARSAMEAYARGVNQFIQQHQKNLPLEFSLLNYKPSPWQASDSLVIAGYMYWTLTSTWQDELDRMKVTERIGPERARDLFREDATMDRFVVGDPNVKEKVETDANAHSDEDDEDDDMQADEVLKAGNLGGSGTPDPGAALRDWVTSTRSEIRHGLGSNNWVVSGAHTATGKPLLANDTHLELTVPPIWYEAHLTAPGWNVKGFTLPGAPLVVIGHNDKIAWGFTNNGADVQDLYSETFTPAMDQYKVRGAWAKPETFDEVIAVKGQASRHFPVVVTRHGPVVRREGAKAYALRWTATEPGGLANTYYYLGKAQNWDEFRAIMKRVWGPAQNAVYADVQGNIGYVMAARVPVRRKGHGEVPVPGDTDDYEWTGYVPFEQLPQIYNPADGLIITANARVTGPAYKPYLTDRWEEPYRTARIYDLLHDKHDLRPADMLEVQSDTYSYPHKFLAEELVAAAKTAAPKDDRTKALLAVAKDWNGIADPDSIAVQFLATTGETAMDMILEPYLGADTRLYQWRSVAVMQRILTERPAAWLPKPFKSYDELLIAAADESVHKLETRTGSAKIDNWTWKQFDSLDMLHPLGQNGLLKKLLGITGKPQGGTRFSPRAATRHHGPAMRFIANLGDWDDSILLVPAGQSGQLGSRHYTDQFSYWYEAQPIVAPFSDAAEARTRKHTLTLRP